ncbi:MAG TPA: GAF domain-containing protein [Stenomitos sp.]
METSIQECQAHSCTLAKVLPIGIFQTDAAGYYLSMNECWCEMAGITVAEAQGDGWLLALYPDDRERVFAEWYRAIQENLPFQSEYRLQRPDGTMTWVLAQAVAQEDHTGSVTGYTGLITDISDRKRIEEALRQQSLKERLMTASLGRIRQSLNLEEILKTTVAEVREFLKTDRVLIYRLWPNGTGSAVTESVVPGWPAVLGQTFPEEVFPSESHEAYCQGRILAISDVEQSIVLPCLVEFVQQFGVKAKLVVPILQDDTLWGLLIAHHCSSPRPWQPLEIDLLQSLATQLAIALQQAELYQQSRKATKTALTQAQQLEQAFSELQRTQAQLVQGEKMSSLGQLVAGVAHEINNPVTFIYANLSHAENYTQDILNLLALYQQQYPSPTPDIQSQIAAIDLEFLIEDLPKLLSSMKVGAERICEIVGSLRNFSRLAEADMKAVDLHEGLDSTLTILQNRLKAHGKYPGIQVIKEYGNLPKVECYAGQLNQVFMNLLSNAIDAIASRFADDALENLNIDPLSVECDSPPPATSTILEDDLSPSHLTPTTPYIRIRTEVVKDQQVAIWIADNGAGMTEQIKARLFDPFFTTKPVGAGTGLGLSISYQIVVKKHGGQIECWSEPGQGTEFLLQIPLSQSKLETRTRSDFFA